MATQKEILGAVVVFKYFMTYQIPHVAKKELEAERNCMLFFQEYKTSQKTQELELSSNSIHKANVRVQSMASLQS